MLNLLARLSRWLDLLSEWTGRMVSWLTLAMVLVTLTIVVLRYAFDLGWISMQELVTYLHATVFLLGAAYTLKHDGHVRVDILYRKFKPATRAWIDLFGTLLLLIPVCLYILYISWDYVAVSWALREGSQEAGGLDGVFILKTTIPLMAILLLLQGLSQMMQSVLLLTGNRDRDMQAAVPEREL
jgi:TRAP-type mannitol/chloroaromatic compound transport system permease small subunit